MRKGGLLDGFPVHLLAGGSKEDTTIIIDSPDLGRLHLVRVPECSRMIIVLSKDRECLERSADVRSNCDGENIHLVQADLKSLPFPDKSISTIVMLSTPNAKASRSASRSGTAFTTLEELARILMPAGSIIEINRRPNRRALREREKSLWWPETQRYYVQPASGPVYFVTQDQVPSPWPFKSLHVGKLHSMRIRANLLFARLGIHSLCNIVGLVIRSKTFGNSLVPRLADETDNYRSEKGKPRLSSQSRFGLYVKAGWNAFLLGGKEPGPARRPIIVKIPLNSACMAPMISHANNIDALNDSEDITLRDIIPRTVDKGNIWGQAYWIETLCEGVSGTKYWWVPRWKRKTVESGCRFLMHLHQSTHQPTLITRDQFDHLLGPHVAPVQETLRRLGSTLELTPLVEALWKAFAHRWIPLVRTHGDFWEANLIVSAKAKVTGVVDWDQSVEHGWPMLDLLDLIASQHKRRAYRHIGSVASKKLMPALFTPWERDLFRNYNARLGLEGDLWVGFVALYWLEYVSRWIQWHTNTKWYDETWLRRNLIATLPDILAYLPHSRFVEN